jgi:hypothetical protein
MLPTTVHFGQNNFSRCRCIVYIISIIFITFLSHINLYSYFIYVSISFSNKFLTNFRAHCS